MACEIEKHNLLTCIGVRQCSEARVKWVECMASTMMARMGHAKTMDERLMERMKRTLKEVLEESIDVPPRPDGMWSDKVLKEIFDSSEKAMIFSENIAKAFKATDTELKDNETFACLICVIKKPKYISEVTGLSPQPEPPDQPRVNYIMEPVIMKQVMDTLEQDKIKY